jgi:spermidine synthase
VYEIAWTRALALVIGSSTYAFSAMLVAFLAGIAGGSALYGWLLARRPATPAMFAALQAALGLAGIVTLVSYEHMPGLFLSALVSSPSVTIVRLAQLALASVALLPTALLSGAAFPCALAMSTVTRSAAARVGRLYTVNTVGAVAGAVLGGVVILPALGVHGSLEAGIAANLAVALAVLMLAPAPRSRAAMVGAAAVGLVVLALVPPWDPRVLSSGPAIYAIAYRDQTAGRSFASLVRGQQVLFYRDGPTSSVSVNSDGRHTFLRINGKTDAGTGDMATQLLLGHLALMLQHAQRVLVIGLGSGITAGAAAAHPVERIDVVEIEPAVVDAARFFAHVNGDVLRDARVRVIIDDARHFIRTTGDRYDVIISEPSNPWISSVSELFTVEFFRLARERLAPGGTMVQWIHGYNLFPDDLRMVVKTFRTAFPTATVWEPGPGDFLLLGRTASTPLDTAHARARFVASDAVRRDLQRLGIQAWPGLFGFLALGEAATARFAEPGRLNTDDALPLEFSAPRALYTDTTAENRRLLRSVRGGDDRPFAGVAELENAEAHYWIGMTYLNRGLVADARAEFQRSLGRDPSYAPAMLAMALTQAVGNAPSVVGAVGTPPAGFAPRP